MYTLLGFYIYTPPIHQYPSSKFTFSISLILFLSLLVSLPIIDQSNFHVFSVDVCYSLRSHTISICSVYSCPLFFLWYFSFNPVVFQSSDIVSQFSSLPVLYPSKSASSIPFIPVYMFTYLFLCLFHYSFHLSPPLFLLCLLFQVSRFTSTICF